MTGLSLVVAVRDRPASLRASLARWSKDPAIDEIVVVDWGSQMPLAHLGVLDVPRTVLVSAGADEPWMRGLALNLGVEAAAGEFVFCASPGLCLPDTAAAVERLRRRGGFLSETGPDAASVLARREDLQAVGGWHEFLFGAGFTGQDLYNRLENAGVRRRFLRDADLEAIALPPLERQPIRSPDETRVELPGALAASAKFAGERNKLLSGLVPWNGAMAAMRPRRMGVLDERRRAFQLGPRTALERRQQDVASYLTARFIGGVPEEVAMPLFAALIDDRSPADEARAARLGQIEQALALLEP